MSESGQPTTTKSWPDYRAVWRWHFYAGLITLPFVIVLSISGAIYLFKPQIEAWNDRAYDSLDINGPRASVAEQVQAALAFVPGRKGRRRSAAAGRREQNRSTRTAPWIRGRRQRRRRNKARTTADSCWRSCRR